MRILVFLVLLLPSVSWAATASWDAVVDPELQGYRLYRAEGACTNPSYFVLAAVYGVVTSGLVPDPPVGGVHCHFLTALNSGGESPASNSVEYLYPITPQCPETTYCNTLKGKARRQCLSCP